jgi:hypothetical protein
MNDKERSNLAERIQKRVQEKHPHFWLIKRRDEIENQILQPNLLAKIRIETCFMTNFIYEKIIYSF